MLTTGSTGSAERSSERLMGSSASKGKNSWRRWEPWAVAVILALGLVLRFHSYTDAPLFNDNSDEVQFAWAGMNLIEHGDPYTWSYYPGYPSYTRFDANGISYPLVHHWMDHPPLFSYLLGGWVLLLGDKRIDQVT